MGKSKELSIDLKEQIIDFNRKSLWAISKQSQFPRSQDQHCKQLFGRIKSMKHLCHYHEQEENTSYHLLLTEN